MLTNSLNYYLFRPIANLIFGRFLFFFNISLISADKKMVELKGENNALVHGMVLHQQQQVNSTKNRVSSSNKCKNQPTVFCSSALLIFHL